MTLEIIITKDDHRLIVLRRPDGLYHYVEEHYHPEEEQAHLVYAGGWTMCTASGLFRSAELAEAHARTSVTWLG
jgi:hypothetical protein